MTRTRKPAGHIAFVGAGPGDPGLLTRRAHDALRARVRQREGRSPEPSAAIIDSQSAKPTGVGGPERG